MGFTEVVEVLHRVADWGGVQREEAIELLVVRDPVIGHCHAFVTGHKYTESQNISHFLGKACFVFISARHVGWQEHFAFYNSLLLPHEPVSKTESTETGLK